jgi:transcriptional regulator with XRE-family HTH domain
MATSRKTTGRRRATRTRDAGKEPTVPPPQTEESTLVGLANQLRSWTDSVLGIAGAAADVSLGAARSMLPKPEQRRALAKAGAVLRSMRETAGLSLRQVGEAINMKDPTLLDLVENGKVALPFEVILRLASVLGRNDPISFVMRFTRSYNPEVWQTLENLGIGRIAVQAGREHEFVNLYRGNDAARRLSDEEFAHALAFTKAAFDMAVAFKSPGKPAPKAKSAPEGK